MIKNTINFVSDLRKLYTCKDMDPTISPATLQNKVQFDLRFFFCRRANENIDKFQKDTFVIQLDPDTGMRYVIKQIDELTKNHREHSTDLVTGIMPELRGSPKCPVSSFEKYFTHLNKQCTSLWQKPKTWEGVSKSGDPTTWYCNVPIGANPLREFMSRMSHSAGLTRVYTNHSIRATGCTFLHRTNFSPKQIMAVTGHHSLNSLSIYEKVSNNEKLTMGLCMNYYLSSDNLLTDMPELPAVINAPKKPRALLPKGSTPTATITKPLQERNINLLQVEAPKEIEKVRENNTETVADRQLVPYEDSEDPLLNDPEMPSDFDLMEYVAQLQNDEENSMMVSSTQHTNKEVSTTTTSYQKTVKKSPNVPIFNNCKIGNITINIQK